MAIMKNFYPGLFLNETGSVSSHLCEVDSQFKNFAVQHIIFIGWATNQFQACACRRSK